MVLVTLNGVIEGETKGPIGRGLEEQASGWKWGLCLPSPGASGTFYIT